MDAQAIAATAFETVASVSCSIFGKSFEPETLEIEGAGEEEKNGDDWIVLNNRPRLIRFLVPKKAESAFSRICFTVLLLCCAVPR